MDSIKCPIVKSDSICYWKEMWQKLDRMRQMWQLCDVSLVTADDRLFMAHSPVLAASSNTLHDMLIRQNQTEIGGDETQKKVFLKNVNSDVLEVTLNFIYGITPSSRPAFEMLQVGAKELDIIGAYEYCRNQLKSLSVETSGTNGEGKSLPATMRLGSQEQNMNPYQWQMNEPSELNDVDGQKCEFSTLAVVSPQHVISDAEEMGLGAVHSVNSTVCWPANEQVPVSDCRASDSSVDTATVSALSSASDNDDCQSVGLNGMPSDDIHTAMFTQMSLVDLTAGVKCPHIKGIIGENNPMDSFLAENELVNENFKNDLRSDESDFDETPTLEERSIDFDVSVPLKKRKISPVEISDGDRGGTESSDQSCIQTKSLCGEDRNLDFQNFLERNAPASSKDSSSHDRNLDLLTCFVSSNSLSPCYSSGSMQAALQQNFTKTSTFDEETVLKPQNVPTSDAGYVQTVCDSEKLRHLEDSLPGCGSSFPSGISRASPCCQKRSAQTDSILDVTRDDLLPSNFSFNIKNSLLSTGMVGDLSDSLLVNQSLNSCRSFLSISKSTADISSNSSQQSVGCQQLRGSIWQDGSAALTLRPCFALPNNGSHAANKLNWEPVPVLEPVSNGVPKLNQELASSSEPKGGLDVAPLCEQKVFTNLDDMFSKHLTSRSQHARSSSRDVVSTLSMHEKQTLCFSTLGPCQGIAPNTLSRNQPIEICPSVADISSPASTFQSSNETFPKESLLAVATSRSQEGYVSSSPEPEGGSDLQRNGNCQCDLCDKVFKNISQLNGHRKRIHLQKTTEPSSTSMHHCQYCQESFKSSYKLQTHQLKVHSKGKLFSCQDCSFRSPRKKDVQAHMLSQHGRAPFGVKVYSCASCNYKCIDRNRFEEHEAKHTGITSHRCPLCSRAYTTKRGMRTHIKYHSEERPHKCSICGAAFKVTSKLSDHMKLIHIQKGVKPYKCGYCDHATALRGNCNQHIRKNHPGQPLLVIDKFASQRKCVKDYDYAGIAGEGIEEHGGLKAANVDIQSSKMAVL